MRTFLGTAVVQWPPLPLLADGSLLAVSRSENPELFSPVIGGYGLFGVIVDVTLHLADDELLERRATWHAGGAGCGGDATLRPARKSEQAVGRVDRETRWSPRMKGPIVRPCIP